ncbi:Unknown protein [Striga hermonthica]|uniref:Uncharacterized protein n=1 Tax=Striga hermonthica TaxID=68872 RepID=A0A9N7MXY9_STRHE|nr:Unknown protein [Striga hermonthica]
MASFWSHSILRPPTSVPAKTPISGGINLRADYLILRARAPFITAGTLSRPPGAVLPQTYVYPGPIAELQMRLSKEKDTFGDDLQTVVSICAEILSDFLHKDYGGPGTLQIEPFTDMMVALKEEKSSQCTISRSIFVTLGTESCRQGLGNLEHQITTTRMMSVY